MSEITPINIYQISPNPYQVRQDEDLAAVAELAANIEKNTLLQPPTVRHIGTHFQIAFGHTRLAAYKLLERQGHEEYKAIPCFIRDLDDLQMFEMAVAENIKRRDLNPIERARAMQTYMETFKKTSAETGEFFSCDEATVRGTVRLLGLPEPAQDSLAAGQITVGAARQLLTLSRIAPEKVEEATSDIVEGAAPEAAVLNQLTNLKSAQVLQASYTHREHPTAGEGLWRLDIGTHPALPHLTSAFAQNAQAVDQEGGKRKGELQAWIDQLESGLVAADALIAQGAPQETIERLDHLVHPPACSQCSYYVQANGTHVCGNKPCWQRKLEAWLRVEAEKLSKKLGIPVYQDADGEYLSLESSWNDDEKELFESKAPGLRLRVTDKQNYGGYAHTNHARIHLVDITPEHLLAEKEKIAQAQHGDTNREERWKVEQAEREAGQGRRERSMSFLDSVAVPVFATCLESIKSESLLIALIDNSGYEEAEEWLHGEDGVEIADPKLRAYRLRCGISSSLLKEQIDWNMRTEGPEKVAEMLVTIADQWGVTLPPDWTEKAAEIQVAPREPDEDEDDKLSEDQEPTEMGEPVGGEEDEEE